VLPYLHTYIYACVCVFVTSEDCDGNTALLCHPVYAIVIRRDVFVSLCVYARIRSFYSLELHPYQMASCLGIPSRKITCTKYLPNFTIFYPYTNHIRKEQVILNRLLIDHTHLTHSLTKNNLQTVITVNLH